MAPIDDDFLARSLIEEGLITAADLAQAQQMSSGPGGLAQSLLQLGLVTAHDLARVAEKQQGQAYLDPPAQPAEAASAQAAVPAAPDVAEQAQPGAAAAPEEPVLAELSSSSLSVPATPAADLAHRASLADYQIDPEALDAIPRSVAEEHEVLPIAMSEDRIIVAMADAMNVFAIDEVRQRTGRKVEPVEVDGAELTKAIDQYYSTRVRDQVLLKTGPTTDLGAAIGQSEAVEGLDDDLIAMLDQAPVVRVVEGMLRQAVRMRASDIHIEPRGEKVVARYRVDGQLHVVMELDAEMHRYVVSRIKILSDIDISETRMPQDGRFTAVVDDRPIDLRVSTLPTYYGEKAVLRILDKSQALVSLTQLGFLPDVQKGYKALLGTPQGMILVTGPTGSGKSTTLYASLHEIKDETRNITTVEDPIEYEVEGVNQCQVHPRIDLTFSRALRSILRQDPDIILVGEIRDLETAEMAFRASLTGHLVLSTLHTNDAPSAATRLLDMDIQPYLIASSIIGVLGQRLVRQICSRCRETTEPTPVELDQLNLTAEEASRITFHRGRGCEHCRNTGHHGRAGIFELMPMTKRLRELITAKATAAEIKDAARAEGMRSMKEDAMLKIDQGLTSAAEIIRAVSTIE